MGATLFPRGGTSTPPGTAGQTLFPRGYATTPPGTAGQALLPGGQSGLTGVPGAPTGVSAVAGDTQATVSFTAPGSDGGSTITGYTVTSSPGGLTGTGGSSPITVTGLTNGVSYTFTVHATNAVGNSAESAASSAVTPAASGLLGPTVTVSADVSEALTGQTVTYTASAAAQDGGATIASYLWDNGDTGVTSERVYTTAGSKTATCTVTDSNAETAQDESDAVTITTTPSYIRISVVSATFPSLDCTNKTLYPHASWTFGGRTVYGGDGADFAVWYSSGKWNVGYEKPSPYTPVGSVSDYQSFDWATDNGEDYPNEDIADWGNDGLEATLTAISVYT